ncbi:MAG: cell division protein ZapA [Bacteroidetes bacterium GWA2_30_7]|nr:MAG: cell division protein ZapA [Bacteroidetes bacterium GWA2_30_7]
MEDNKLSINLNIIDRFYPLRIEVKEEEKIRKAAKLINDKVMQYKQKYTDKDTQDFLAMAALQYVSKVLELENNQDKKPLVNELQEIEKELEDYLQKQ